MNDFKLGSEVFLEKEWRNYSGMRLGLLTNATGVDHEFVSTIDRFYNHSELSLTTLFSPEHGIRGTEEAGQKIKDTIDAKTGLPIYSLYSDKGVIEPSLFEEIDVLFCDLQDIGVRYFTFIYTLADIMKISAAADIRVVVLDRPNPIGDKVEGNRIRETFNSFVGAYTLPVRHGMTIGEIANFLQGEFHNSCMLTVVPMEGWKRSSYFDELNMPWVPPTPNATGVEMALLYGGTCLLEGTNISEGRGTTAPFRLIGAPFIDGEELAERLRREKWKGVGIRPTSFQPCMSKHEGKTCGGVELHVTDRDTFEAFRTGSEILKIIVELYPGKVEFLKNADFGGAYFLDLLFGNDELRLQLSEGKPVPLVGEKPAITFSEERKPYLLYV